MSAWQISEAGGGGEELLFGGSRMRPGVLVATSAARNCAPDRQKTQSHPNSGQFKVKLSSRFDLKATKAALIKTQHSFL